MFAAAGRLLPFMEGLHLLHNRILSEPSQQRHPLACLEPEEIRMEGRLKALLLAALLVAPAPLLAQGTVLGDTVWVAAPTGAVGRAITVAPSGRRPPTRGALSTRRARHPRAAG